MIRSVLSRPFVAAARLETIVLDRKALVPRGATLHLVGFSLAAFLAIGCGTPEPLPEELAAGRGENALAEGEIGHARRYLAEAVAHDPGDTESWRRACQAWSSGPDQQPARIIDACGGFLERAGAESEAEGEPLREDRSWDDAVARLIDALMGQGDRTQALAWSERLRDPATAATGQAALWLDEDPARALAALEPVLSEDPEDAEFHDAAAAVFEALGRPDEVRHHLERSQAIEPLRSDVHERLAAWAEQAGDAPMVALQTARATALARYEALAEPGVESLSADGEPTGEPMDDTARNAERLRLLIKLDEDFPRRHPDVRLAKAWLEIQLGHLDRGRQRLDGLARQKLLEDEHRLAFAELFQAEERHGIVREWLEPMVAADPGNERARAILLRTLLTLNALPAARVLLEEGLAVSPYRASFHAELSRITEIQGSSSGFERHLRRAIELSPWTPELRIRLAASMLERGRKGDARALIAASPVSSPDLDAFVVENGLEEKKDD